VNSLTDRNLGRTDCGANARRVSGVCARFQIVRSKLEPVADSKVAADLRQIENDFIVAYLSHT
jgi:hypothetical protein